MSLPREEVDPPEDFLRHSVEVIRPHGGGVHLALFHHLFRQLEEEHVPVDRHVVPAGVKVLGIPAGLSMYKLINDQAITPIPGSERRLAWCSTVIRAP